MRVESKRIDQGETEKVRFIWLDLLRGFCAIQVAAFHFFSENSWLRYNWMFVDLFFVLSGFVLFRKFPDYRVAKSGAKVFTINRLLRFMPLLMLSLLFKFVLLQFQLIEKEISMSDFLQSIAGLFSCLFFLQIVFPATTLVLVPLWSLTTEFWVNIATCYLELSKTRNRIVFLILTGLVLIVVSNFLGLNPENFSSYVTWLYLLGRTMCGFGLGLFLAKFVKEREQKISNLRLLSIFLFIFAVAIYVGKFAETFLLLPVEFLFVSTVILLSNLKNPSGNSRTAKISHVLGSSSFGVYVFHPLFFVVGNRFIGLKTPTVISFLIQISFVVFVAWAMDKYVQPPIREKLGRFLGKTHR